MWSVEKKKKKRKRKKEKVENIRINFIFILEIDDSFSKFLCSVNSIYEFSCIINLVTIIHVFTNPSARAGGAKGQFF